jgi:hypothetical protein
MSNMVWLSSAISLPYTTHDTPESITITLQKMEIVFMFNLFWLDQGEKGCFKSKGTKGRRNTL